jgi:hypothetical protein
VNRLHKLWEDLDENWGHRETFLHQAFSSPHEHFSLISNETLRLFEIRWLDLRVLGLIDQRETCLKRIADVSEKRNPRDLKRNQKLIEDDILIYRTLTLYISEYIQTWLSKNPDKKCYLWNGKDYLLKMNNDYTKMVNRSKRLLTIVEELQLTVTTLCLPKKPHLYFKFFAEKAKRQQEILDPNKQSDEKFEHRSRTPSAYSASQFDLYPNTTNGTQQSSEAVTPLNGLRGSMSRLPTTAGTEATPTAAITDINTSIQSVPQPIPHFGKVLKFQKRVNLEDIREDQLYSPNTKAFITGIDYNESDKQKSVKFSDQITPPKANKSAKEPEKIKDEIEQQMHLPPLLIHQSFKERKKRHKKYSEPLCSIRHEDLMEKLQEDQPWYVTELLNRKKNALSDSKQSPTHGNSQLQHIQQLLGKANNYIKKMQEQRVDFEIPKGFNPNPTVVKDPLDELDDTDVEFPEPNLAEDVERLRRAQTFISDHSATNDTNSSGKNSKSNSTTSSNISSTVVSRSSTAARIK